MRHLILTLTGAAIFISAMSTSWAAGPGNLNRVEAGQDVQASISSPFSDLPPGGCVPYQVTIRNDRGTAGTWHVNFQGVANTSSLGATALEEDLSVGPNASGTFDLLVPLPVVSAERGGTSLNVGVSGPGFNSGYNNFFAYFYTNNTSVRSPFTLIGHNVLGTVGTSPLEAYYKTKSAEFYGSIVEAQTLPSDWRAYAGVASFILSDFEWLSLNPTQREAVCDYVAQGGHLSLFTTQNIEARTPELQLPEPDGQPGPYGFGTISLVSAVSFPPEPETLRSVLEEHPAMTAQVVDQGFSSWNLRQMVGTIAVSAAFILTFVVLFGSLVGPINLFVFARGKNRIRLFWTTPLISLAASLLLVVGILVTDGIGGSGKQMIAIFSLPATHREAVVQEEVAHTAVLFSNRWHSDQNYLITPVSANAMADALAEQRGSAYRGRRANLSDSPDTYHQSGNEYSGNWFRSRAVSGHYLAATRPSRSALTVLNPAAPGTAQVPPVVLSSYAEELVKVYVIDPDGYYWTCENLAPGQKQTCVASSASEFNSFWTNACKDSGGKLRPLLSSAANRKGCFYATGTPTSGETLATLGEIRWQVVSGVYLGPWVSSPTPEAGP